MIDDIADYTKKDGIKYTEYVMEKVLEVTRTYSPKTIVERNKLYRDLYPKIVEGINKLFVNMESQSHSFHKQKGLMWVDITLLYILLFCLDLSMFRSYKGSDPQTKEQYDYYDKIENNLLRNLYLNGHLSDLNMNHLINMIQRYEMFYPINDNSYYLEMIRSLKRSNINKINPISINSIDLTESNIDKINSDMLKIEAIRLINRIITINFGTHIESYSKNQGIKTINYIEFNDPNTKLNQIMSAIIKDEYYYPYIEKETLQQKTIYSDMSKLRLNHAINATTDNNWKMKFFKEDTLCILYFDIDSSIDSDIFTFDITCYDKVTRIKPKSNVIILDMNKFTPEDTFSGYNHSAQFTISSQYIINELRVFFIHHENDDYLELFNNAHTNYELSYYIARPLKNNNVAKIIDIEDIQKTIATGDLKNAEHKLDKYFINISNDKWSKNIIVCYSLYPNSKYYDPIIFSNMNAYVSTNIHNQDEYGSNISLTPVVYHNPFDIVDYINYYRIIMTKMLKDPLIVALYDDQHSTINNHDSTGYVEKNYKVAVCSKLTKLAVMLGLVQSIPVSDIKSTKQQDESTVNVIIQTGRSGPSFTIIPKKKPKYHNANEININSFNIMGAYIITDNEIMINGFEIVQSPSHIITLTNIFQANNDMKSLNFLHNTLQISLEIDRCFMGIKFDNKKELVQIRLFIVFNDKILDHMINISKLFPWNKTNDHVPEPDYNRYDKKDNISYITFNSYQFENIIPEVNITDNNECRMFIEFCYFLLINQSYKILNMYLPIIVSIYQANKMEYVDKFVSFILHNKYFNSPYNYYMLNKLNFMIYGAFNTNFVYNLSKRQSYYPIIYTDIDPNYQLIEYKIHDELSIYNEWLNIINPYVRILDLKDPKNLKDSNSNIITLDILRSIITMLDEKVKAQNLTYQYVKLDDVINFGDPIRYLLNETNYRSLFCNIQLDILTKIRSIAFDDKIKDDIEIIGNIKYFINKTFNHNNVKLNKSFDSKRTNYVDASIKLFELITGKIVDSVQHSFIHNMINDEKISQYKVYELLMGRGKTYVIIPCILLTYYYNQRYQNIIQCMPSHLIMQSSKVLGRFLPFMNTGYIYNLQVNRDTKRNSYGIYNSYDKISISSILESSISKVIITDDINIKSELLLRVETELKNTKSNSQYGGGYIELDYSYEKIGEIIDPIFDALNANRKNYNDGESFTIKDENLADNSIIVIDEFDMLIDPLRSDLNFPISTYSNIDHQDILIKIVLNITQELFKKYHTYMMRSDRTNERINKLIIRKIMLDMDNMVYSDIKTLIQRVYSKFKSGINKKDIPEQFKQFLKSENREIMKYREEKIISGLSGGGFDDLLLYYIRETYKIYQNALTMLLDKDYGWDDTDLKNPYIAIPYTAQDSPMKGSQFSDIIINIVLTSITYCQKGLRMLDVKNFIRYIKFASKRLSIHQLKRILRLDQKLIEFSMIESERGFYNHMQYLYKNNYPEYIDAICTYLEKVILIQYVKMDPDILNSSFIDIIDPNFIKAKFAVSGTTNIHLPKFNYYGNHNILKNIVKDEITQRNIETALRGNNLGVDKMGKADVIVIKSNVTTNDILKLMKDYQVLIDTGSFLRYDTNLSIGNKLSSMYEDHYIIIFDENDLPIVILNNNKIDYNIDRLKYEILYKVYYDQKHTVGTDLDLPSSAKGLVTIHKFSTYTQIVQGLFRMREINYYQHHDYLIKDDTSQQLTNISTLATSTSRSTLSTSSITNISTKSRSSVINKLELLIKFLQMNEDKKYQISKFKYLQQLILCMYRTISDYVPDSYIVKVFVPSENNVDNSIMRDYDYNFSKIHFINMMKHKINEYSSSNDDSKIKLFKELVGTLQIISTMNREGSSIMIQKQSENVKNITKEIAYEKNYTFHQTFTNKIVLNNISYGDLIKKLACIDIITNSILVSCHDPIIKMSILDERYEEVNIENEFDEYDPYNSYTKRPKQVKMWVERTVPLIEYVQQLGISISPESLQTIYKLFNSDETESFYTCYNKITKIITLLTSSDVVFINVRYHNVINLIEIKPVVEFNNNAINNLILMAKFSIPTDDVLPIIKSMDIIDSQRAIILDYYEKYFIYKLISVSPMFYHYLKNGTIQYENI